jgi:hypothetical protein
MAEIGIRCYDRRWVKLAEVPVARSLGWSPIVWTSNEAHAERWLTAEAAADFAARNMRGDGWAVEALSESGSRLPGLLKV